MEAVRVNQNSEVADVKTITVSLKLLKCSVELRGTPKVGKKSMVVHYYDQHL